MSMRRLISKYMKPQEKSGNDKSQEKSPERTAIEAQAFEEMRKAKAAIDPSVLSKVRSAIMKSPMGKQMMGGAAAQDADKNASEDVKPPVSNAILERAEVDVDTAVHEGDASETPTKPQRTVDPKQAARAVHEKIKAKEPTVSAPPSIEEVDKSKMFDIVSKMLEQNPHKAGLKQGIRDILTKK